MRAAVVGLAIDRRHAAEVDHVADKALITASGSRGGGPPCHAHGGRRRGRAGHDRGRTARIPWPPEPVVEVTVDASPA